MSAQARRRRAAAKANPYSKAVGAPRIPPDGCMARCPECLTRCMACCDPDNCETHRDHEHWFACDH